VIWLALTLLAPLGAGLAALAVRRAPQAFALVGAALGLVGALGLFASAAAGTEISVSLPFLPSFPVLLMAFSAPC
jgi:NADH-quinone oxidoreductase subunit L